MKKRNKYSKDEHLNKLLEMELQARKEQGIDITPKEVKRAYNRIYCRRYRDRNKDKLREYNRKYREQHKDKITQYHREYRERNKAHIREYQKQYKRKNRAKIQARAEKKFEEIADRFNKNNL